MIKHVLIALILHNAATACTIDQNVIVCEYVSDQEISLLLDAAIHKVIIKDYTDELFGFNSFVNGSALYEIDIRDGDIEAMARFDHNRSVALNSVRVLSLSNAEFNESMEDTINLLNQWMPHLDEVKFEYVTFEPSRENYTIEPSKSITKLRCQNCRLSNITTLPTNLNELDLSFNKLVNLPEIPPNVQHLDLSHNRLSSLDFVTRVRIEQLNVSANEIKMLDFDRLSNQLPLLQNLDLSLNARLNHLFGRVPRSLQHLSARNTSLRAFNANFLTASKLVTLDLRSSPLWCGCAASWILESPQIINLLLDQNCVGPNTFARQAVASKNSTNCYKERSILYSNETILRFQYGEDVILPALVHPFETSTVQWTKIYPRTIIGIWPDPVTQANNINSTADKYKILPGGDLLIHSIDKNDVERYMLSMPGSDTEPVIILVRLDYSSWFYVEIYSIVAACVACAVGFAGHMLWTIICKLTLWRINKAERTSKVKNMLEAVEKYRVGKMNQLQSSYQVRLQAIRDNYNAQLEQLWSSYAGQTERLKNYKDARVESMTGHFGNVKDNYNSQVTRMREYWRAQMERLGENYERQLNRLRAYSLQNRLKLARQYKVKQSYLKKILESLTLQETAREDQTPRIIADPEELLTPKDRMPSFDSSSINTFYSCADFDEFDVTTPFKSIYNESEQCTSRSRTTPADEQQSRSDDEAVSSRATVHRLIHENYDSVVLLTDNRHNQQSSLNAITQTETML